MVDHDTEKYLMHFQPEQPFSIGAKSFTALVCIDALNLNRDHLAEPALDRVQRRCPMAKKWIRTCLIFLVMVSPICMNAAISHFQTGQSTRPQRLWAMVWLFVGTVGRVVTMYGPIKEYSYAEWDDDDRFWTVSTMTMCLLLYGMPVIGDIQVVTRMLIEYGSCKRFD